MTAEIGFSGWMECRLATNPDPFDDKRGVSGWTFALPGEPDLDRIIRFQPTGAVSRWGGPSIGVTVKRVRIGGAENPVHSLMGGTVELMQSAVFEGRNGIVAADAYEPIWPFDIEVRQGAFQCRRAMLDPATGNPELIKSTGRGGDPASFAQTSIADKAAYRAARAQALSQRLATEQDRKVKAGLKKRSDWLTLPNKDGALMWGPVPPEFFVYYDYSLRGGGAQFNDPAGTLPNVALNQDWRAELRIGAWDADALAAFVVGTLTLPTE